MKIVVWHNIMWSRYKATVFSALQAICLQRNTTLQVFQIAETADQRSGLSPTDTSWHRYPYELLFKGSYETIPRLSLFWAVARKTWTNDADVTVLAGYDRPEYWIQAIILLLRRKPFACFCDSTVFDNEQKLITGLLKRLFFRWCSGIFCYGARAAEYVKLYGATQDKIIHRCQAAALYEGYSPEAALTRRLELFDPSAPPRFVYVGRFSKEKSIDQLMLAFDRVRTTLPAAKLVLVGGGPEEARLRLLCDQMGLNNHITFAGAKHGTALFEEYLRSTALVLPSFSEPWGLVVNEALSHACPVIVSDRCGCVPELVIDGKTGFSFSWGDINDLEAKMYALATEDHALRLSRMCLEQIAPFTPENAARSIMDGAIVLAARNQPELIAQ